MPAVSDVYGVDFGHVLGAALLGPLVIIGGVVHFRPPATRWDAPPGSHERLPASRLDAEALFIRWREPGLVRAGLLLLAVLRLSPHLIPRSQAAFVFSEHFLPDIRNIRGIFRDEPMPN